MYYFGRCSSELAQLVAAPYFRGRSTRYSLNDIQTNTRQYLSNTLVGIPLCCVLFRKTLDRKNFLFIGINDMDLEIHFWSVNHTLVASICNNNANGKPKAVYIRFSNHQYLLNLIAQSKTSFFNNITSNIAIIY